METQTVDQLASKRCTACERGVDPQARVEKYSPREVRNQLKLLTGWRSTHDGLRIRRDWQMRNFLAGMDLLTKTAQVAEGEGHHPDLHLEGYRHVWIELWTHAIGGLSENDFILAAKIDRLPVRVAGSTQ